MEGVDLRLPYAFRIDSPEKENISSHPTIHSVLQLHVVNSHHNVKNGLKLENKLNSNRNARNHTPSVLEFFLLVCGLCLLRRNQTTALKKKYS